MPPQPGTAAPQTPLWVVLDTNVVLDLLVFGDLRAQALHQALNAGLLQAMATAAMFDELEDVLSRPFLAQRPVMAANVLAEARALCLQVEAPAAKASGAPRCADPDDQIFIDLAWSRPVRWLFSRDRALLNLARAAGPRGLGVLTPAAWAALQTAPHEASCASP